MSTSAALIDAAEGAFADDGFEGASLRAVMRAAGADPGAVHYHFGGREALAAAVLDRVLAPLNARRLELLDQAVARQPADAGVGVPDLIEAIIRPDVETAFTLDGRGQGRARLVGAIYVNPAAFVTAEVERHFGPVAQRFMPHLGAAVPEVPADVLAWRIRWCVFGTVGALLLDRDEPATVGLDRLVDRLVAASSGAVTAPVERRGS